MLTAEDILALSHQLTCAGHWYVRLDDNRVVWSEEVFRIHGVSPEAFQPTIETALDFYHPDDRPDVEAAIEETLSSGQALSFQARIVQPGGGVRWVEVAGRIKQDAQRAAGFLFGVFRDITDVQEQRLHNQRLAWVLENTPEAIVMTDPDGRVTWVNQAFERITGYGFADVKGWRPGEFLQGPDTDPDTVALMRERLAQEQGFTTEILNYRHDGAAYWLRISCQPEYDRHGDLLGFTAIQSDITTERQIREDLEAEIEARQRLEDRLRHLASHDELTGLPNRRFFMDQGRAEIARSYRYRHPLSVLLLDLDHFKQINDQHGHATGDAVLGAFAQRCRTLLRESDMVARIGGEEFAMLLPQTDADNGAVVAERLRRHLADAPIETDSGAIPLTVSAGLATLPAEQVGIDTLLQQADERLYRAKEQGRNRVVR